MNITWELEIMSFDEIIGQENAKKILINSLDRGRTVNAYIFSGPGGVGKYFTAKVFAKALNCIEKDKPCGICPQCGKIQRNVHPDVRVIDGGKSSIKIDEIRELQEDMSLRPYEGHYKIYIIKNAENMTTQAANSLLKTLEEPPDYGIIILTTSNYHILLPTIISRSQIVSFNPIPQRDMEEFLKDKFVGNSDKIKLLSAFARGSIGQALKLAEDEEFIELRNICTRFLEILTEENNEREVFLFVDELIKRKKSINEVLNILIFIFRDLMLLKTYKQETIIVNSDIKEKLIYHSKILSIEGIYNILETIKKMKYDLNSNVNFNIAVEVMLSKIMGVYKDELYGSRSPI